MVGRNIYVSPKTEALQKIGTEDAEDIVQQALVKAFRKLDGFPTMSHPKFFVSTGRRIYATSAALTTA